VAALGPPELDAGAAVGAPAVQVREAPQVADPRRAVTVPGSGAGDVRPRITNTERERRLRAVANDQARSPGGRLEDRQRASAHEWVSVPLFRPIASHHRHPNGQPHRTQQPRFSGM